MYKLSYKKRVWIIKQFRRGISVGSIALAQRIDRRTVYKILEKFQEFGWDGLKDHKTGRSEIILNPNAELLILDLRKQYNYGACRIEQVLKRKGFSISHRQIEKVIIRNNLVIPNKRKQKSRKWVRYELPNPNDLWHTDWSHDPFTGKNLSVYIDDRTRLLTSFGIFNRASTTNSVALLKVGIAEYGKPKSIMTDRGSQYYSNHPDSDQSNTEFRKALNILSIKHYVTRKSRPQTNGKVERFFLTYKTEYATGSFTNVNDYVRHYNEERPHMSLYWKTPMDVWSELNEP